MGPLFGDPSNLVSPLRFPILPALDRSSHADSHNRLRSFFRGKERPCQRKLHLSGKTPKRRHQIEVPLHYLIRRTSDETSRQIVSQTDRLVKSLWLSKLRPVSSLVLWEDCLRDNEAYYVTCQRLCQGVFDQFFTEAKNSFRRACVYPHILYFPLNSMKKSEGSFPFPGIDCSIAIV